MAKITLTGGFSPLAEGYYTFRVKSCEYKEDFGKLHFVLETKTGRTVFNDYNFGVNSENSGAINSFSFFARMVLNNPSAEEVDPEELVGKYVKAEVVHSTGTKLDEKGNPKIFVNLKNWESASGFEESASKIDLDSILD